jgi:hypothetical protein
VDLDDLGLLMLAELGLGIRCINAAMLRDQPHQERYRHQSLHRSSWVRRPT